MKLLLDECLPRKLKFSFADHDVMTVPEMGWSGKHNGELMALAAGERFDAFLTADQNLTYQQNLENTAIAVIVLKASNTRLSMLEPLVPKVLSALSEIAVGKIIYID